MCSSGANPGKPLLILPRKGSPCIFISGSRPLAGLVTFASLGAGATVLAAPASAGGSCAGSTVRLGSGTGDPRGGCVREAQYRLRDCGFGVVADDRFGPAPRRAAP